MPKLTKSLIDKLDAIRMQCDEEVELDVDPFNKDYILWTPPINGSRTYAFSRKNLEEVCDRFLRAIEQKSTESKTKNL